VLTSVNRACQNLVPTFPQRSPPSLLGQQLAVALDQHLIADLEGPSFISEAQFRLQPLHYLALRETKALGQAAPLDNWRLADCVHRLRRTHGSADGETRDEHRLRVLQKQQSVANQWRPSKLKRSIPRRLGCEV
jgi:hypothetical protein